MPVDRYAAKPDYEDSPADATTWEAMVNTALAELAAALISAASAAEVSHLVLDHAKRLTNSVFGFVGHIDPDTGFFIPSSMTRDIWDACQVEDKETAFAKFGGLWGWVLEKRESVYANILERDPRSGGTPPGHIPVFSFLGVPAMIDDELIGMVALANSDRDYAERDLRLVERLAALYAVAVQRTRSEESLRRQRDFIAAVLDTIANLVVVLDREGRIVRFNRACELTTGYAFDQVEGKPFWDYFLLPEEIEPVKAVFGDVIAGRFPNTHENYWLTRDGRRRLVAWTNTALLDGKGQVAYVIAAGTDVTEQRRAEESLQRYRMLAMHARDIVLLLTREGKVLEANEAAVKAYGYSPEEFLTLSVRDLRTPETTPLVAAQMARAEAGGILFETVHRRKDGTTFPVEVSSQGADIGGQRVLLGIIRDITERKQAEAERVRLVAELQRHAAQLRGTLSSIADGLVVYDQEGNVVTMNDAAVALLGFSEEQMALPLAERVKLLRAETAAGRPLTPDETPAARALRGETVRSQVVAFHATGRPVWVSISAAPVRTEDGRLLGAVSSFADIGGLHNLQEQREDYIRTISHDLRNPLTVIIGMSELLHGRLARQGLEREAEMADKVMRSARSMNAMVADLVESIRMESGQLKLRPEPTDLARLAADVLERTGTPDERARLHLEAQDGLPPALVDGERVERALVNLVTNALKYSPPDTTVVVRLTASGEGLVLAVEDQGYGIPGEDLANVFQRFYRVKATETREGLGLGLYITRLIAEAHGGRVWVESELGLGSTFYISLPAARP